MPATVRRRSLALLAVACLALGTAQASPPTDRTRVVLSFEDRVVAEEAIQRAYYAHQLDTTRSFEAAVPREVLERKVDTYLRQSAALARVWQRPITDAALERELERIAASSYFPDRLREIYAALGDDPVLVKECFVRPVLAERLTRNFYAGDRRLHAASWQEAESLQRALRDGIREPEPRDPVLQEFVRARGGPRSTGPVGPQRPILLDAEQFDRHRAAAPRGVGEVGPVVETRDGFSIRVLLSESADRFRVATYTVPKRTWESWWEETRPELDPGEVLAVADADPLPEPGEGPTGGGAFTEGGVCVFEGTWNNGNLDEVPEPRINHSSIWTGNLMIIWGGFGLPGVLISGARYDPLTDTWSDVNKLNAPQARHIHSTVWTGSEMMVWGGLVSTGETSTGGRYDVATDSWTSISTVGAPSARKSHSAVWSGSEMIVWGGTLGTTSIITGGRYDAATGSWTPTAIDTSTPGGREGHSAVWTGSLMVIWGGGSSRALSDGARYDPSTDSWSPMNNLGPIGRINHTTLWTGDRMLVWGGFNFPDPLNTVLNSGGFYDPVTDSWSLLSTFNAPVARRNHAAAWTGEDLIVWGGASGTTLDSGGIYHTDTNSWTPTTKDGAPRRRQLHSAVWTGKEMIIWSGTGPDNLTASGSRYDPVTDSWAPTTFATGQPARKNHTAVWTGSEMIVWGGVGNAQLSLSTGARYDPVTDSWTDVTTTGAAEGRERHVAFWTGNRMLVYGGFDGATFLDTGGRYDPLTDMWTLNSTAGSPGPRSSPGAAWTGSEMLVWGGFDAGTYFQTGARYDPLADTWTPMSTVGAPAPRLLHSLDWTGTEAIVWGGDSILGLLDTGGRYDPSTDTWSPVSAVGAPPPRMRHLSVWSGDELVVWGGRDVDNFLTSGGRYDPATDTWQPTTTVNAPSGRVNSSAVWTGTEMVVWGGFDESSFPYMDSGGRYDPAADTWTPTTVDRAPSARNEHSAASLNGLMVIWGGSDGSVLNTGGRFVVGALVDADSDGTADLCDNCPADPNAGQEDGDQDGFGDVCDNCPNIFNDTQADVDLDGTGNPCDNCPVTANVDQADGDLDGAGDVCDCAPGDGGAFAIPGEVENVLFAADGVTLSWDSAAAGAGTGTQYQGLRGLVGELPVGAGASEVCIDPIVGTSTADPSVPPSGAAFWYVIRAGNSCGNGPYGSGSAGLRSSTTCP